MTQVASDVNNCAETTFEVITCRLDLNFLTFRLGRAERPDVDRRIVVDNFSRRDLAKRQQLYLLQRKTQHNHDEVYFT